VRAIRAGQNRSPDGDSVNSTSIGGAVTSVVLSWHIDERDNAEDSKLIGAYATERDAGAAKQRLSDKPGFTDTPSGFMMERYEINVDHWTEGFVITND
jgi:hypothetical protein